MCQSHRVQSTVRIKSIYELCFILQLQLGLPFDVFTLAIVFCFFFISFIIIIFIKFSFT